MRAGRLDQRVRIERPGAGRDAAGGAVPVPWILVAADVPASVFGQKGDEAFRAAAMDAHRTIRLLLRRGLDVDTTMRVVWGGQAYRIVDVNSTRLRAGEMWLTARAQLK